MSGLALAAAASRACKGIARETYLFLYVDLQTLDIRNATVAGELYMQAPCAAHILYSLMADRSRSPQQRSPDSCTTHLWCDRRSMLDTPLDFAHARIGNGVRTVESKYKLLIIVISQFTPAKACMGVSVLTPSL